MRSRANFIGFFTSRVIGTFINEAIAMVGEGVSAVSVEQAATQAGYPVGALKLIDEINMKLSLKIADEYKRALEAAGKEPQTHPALAVMQKMVNELNRPGKLDGGGFYEYPENGKAHIWPGLKDVFGDTTNIPFRDMQERMMFAEAIETVKCFDEGVLESIGDANIGSIFGIGFPAWTGGVMQYSTSTTAACAGLLPGPRSWLRSTATASTPGESGGEGGEGRDVPITPVFPFSAGAFFSPACGTSAAERPKAGPKGERRRRE